MNNHEARLKCFKAWQAFRKALRDKLAAEQIQAAKEKFISCRAEYLNSRLKVQAQ